MVIGKKTLSVNPIRHRCSSECCSLHLHQNCHELKNVTFIPSESRHQLFCFSFTFAEVHSILVYLWSHSKHLSLSSTPSSKKLGSVFFGFFSSVFFFLMAGFSLSFQPVHRFFLCFFQIFFSNLRDVLHPSSVLSHQVQ